MNSIDKVEIEAVGSVLRDEARPLKERFRALFTLRNLGGKSTIEAISSCFSDPSALLKHELAYCLGQMQDDCAIPILIDVLKNRDQEPIVRHEAGEALGAIGSSKTLAVLEEYCNDPVIEVAETCQLARDRINFLAASDKTSNDHQISFTSIDPAPPSSEKDISKLKDSLMDPSNSLFDRYRAMFALRNINSAESALAVTEGFKGTSALFRHEIGFVLGQMAFAEVVDELMAVVNNKEESDMVRHEAAEALGSIASDKAMSILKEYLNDEARVVRESCEIALDMGDYENSSEFQYANSLIKVRKNH